MATPAPAVAWAQYLALRGVTSLMQCFDVEENLRTAGAVGSMFARFSPRHRRRAERNIALSFPEYSAEQVRRVAEGSMRYMFQLFMVDTIAAPRLITPASWPQYLRLDGIEPVLDRLIRQRRGIFLTGHCGNWELLGFALSALGYPISALARPLDNPLINRWLLAMREKRGLRVIPKFGAATVLPDLLSREGRVGFIADQNAGDQGSFVPFFGRLASSYKSIGLLAIRYETPIYVGHALREHGRMRYVVRCEDVIRPDDWVDQPDPLYYVTARFNRALEKTIRRAPEQYLWVHRRWKSRPRHEREGSPFPSRLRRKLEQLPWMTEADLAAIIDRSTDPNHREEGESGR
ncbi:MAG: lysophospholipid acyltransferase family protein [Phycisphaerales bacterium]|nr:lysophospholipid acyltransferase family protein [Phycisphaerae bacterium]NNF41737.1 lysophospholipid acyltransferase family protein [Phycisphaerales bacterium]NNM25677.1 lysophospholipid acyltransferase family protein [Phycisphaerales bacterium]